MTSTSTTTSWARPLKMRSMNIMDETTMVQAFLADVEHADEHVLNFKLADFPN